MDTATILFPLSRLLPNRTYGGRKTDEESASCWSNILMLLLLAVFWIYPAVSAFTCGSSPTTMGLNGVFWGIFILLTGPLLGVLYLFFGACQKAAVVEMIEPLPFSTNEYFQ